MSHARTGAIAASLLLAGGAAAIASAAPSGAEEQSKPTTTKIAGPLGTYAVFDQAPESRDDVSGWKAARLSTGGYDFSRARVVYSGAALTAAAVPAKDGPCLVLRFADDSGGISCNQPDEPAMVSGPGASVGVVPDTVENVTVTFASSEARVVAVVDNAWTAPEGATSVSFKLAGKTVTQELWTAKQVPAGATVQPGGVIASKTSPLVP